jgi:AraC-like DNA-binding protein
MDALLVEMRDPALAAAGGGHNSSGWQVDSPWHYHDMHQLLYAFAGSVDVEGLEASFRIPHQFAAWIPAGVVHRTRIQQVDSGSVFLAGELVPTAGERLRVIRASALLREMIAHGMRWSLGRAEDDDSRAYFACMARLCPEWIADEVQLVLPSCRDPKIEGVIETTRGSLATITFGQVSRKAGLSERSLRRKFSAETGLSWEVYRRRLRILTSIEKIDSSDDTIGCIAADVGYENQAAFAKAFRDTVGMAPSEYRRRKRHSAI